LPTSGDALVLALAAEGSAACGNRRVIVKEADE
jgi:hypothetical protein